METLEARFTAGSDGALEEAYHRHGSLVYTFARRQLDADQARDLTQEVFVAAWRACHRFNQDRGSLQAWLMSIAKNKVIDVYRRQARRPRTVGHEDAGGWERHATESDQPGRAIERMADRMLLTEAMETLPDRARSVIELSFYGQLTHVEIAEQTGLPLGTVKSDLRRSLLRLKTHLEPQLEVSHDR